MARRKKGRSLDPQDVLAGRAAAGIHQIVALIHEVNPTDRGLSPREQERAYAEKAALQSLLLRRFEDHVAITESAPGVIALSLRETVSRPRTARSTPSTRIRGKTSGGSS